MLKKRVICALVLGAMLSLSFCIPSIAAVDKIPTGGSLMLSNSQVTPMTVVDVGGGKWDYGWYPLSTIIKYVWSNYNHPSRNHHATTFIGAESDHSGIHPPYSLAPSHKTGLITTPSSVYWGLD